MGKADKPEKNNNKQKHFWKDFKAELKKVIWPTRSQVANNTIIVLVIVLIVTAICFVLDLAFEALNTYGIDNLKSMVQNTEVEPDNTVDNTVSNDNNTTDTNSAAENTTDNQSTENSLSNTANDTTEMQNISE